ncbi:fibronectin type III domain-containing protein [Enterococcus durans]|uniref:fibronectin type III domain-containing protein n=1 Tax=Enterococcus durans TaxID=53345 RepID=UPI00102239D9|nr:fibronectin type III domain-containing protein [Enterococcus durans]MDU1849623.1 fibronectin type III domain-containing protein [Enterococcus durans]MZG90069.1 LPXTG cell wall anchor domain-containing protein [Enterococcus durans]MZG92771.1 LPXTG cell wall anchor domain-containing protein [Enterococcus durans]MZH19754.1 LPXTG cell wall anchor domain-containing protein [Enterococcus durans]MZH22443.1 LPXTG cell wall anchor domain-containing protein [Enterococcus durans]
MKSIRKYLPLFAMLLLFIKPFVAVAVSTQGSVEEVIIKNGEFNEGLKDWIVSSPGENNPSLVVDSNGNQYVKATNGENILQYVQLKPNSTYRFAYYVIGDPVFPAIVEFGTLNHDQGYHSLKEEKHYNIAWKQHEFIFTTPTDENTYVIRFASSGNGEAKFDNIQAAWLDLESPSIPQNLLVESVTSDTVSLSWDASTDNIGVAGYRVYRDKQLVQEVQGEQFTDTGLTEDTEYTYEVRAFDIAGNQSEASNEVFARTSVSVDDEAPTIPLNLKVENVTTDTVSLSWGASTDNIGVAGYRVYRDKQLVQEVQGEQFTDTGLMEDAEYTYEVRAFDAAGNQSEVSNRINVRTKGIVDHKPPTTPMNVRATVVTENKVTLLWEASSDESGIRSYQVYRNSILVGSLPGDTLSYTDTNLSEKTKYYYTITACDHAGNVSVASKALLITTKGTTLPPIVEEKPKEEKPKEEKPSPSVPQPPQKENIGNSTVDASDNKMEKEQTGMINQEKNRPVDHSLNLTAEAIQKISKILTKDSVKKLPMTGTQKNALVKMSGVGITVISLCLFYIRKRRK